MYKVEISPQAIKALSKLDKLTARLITSWIRKNLENCDNPRVYGRGLVADRSGQWRYRIGKYRVIAQIFDDKVLILIVDVGPRDKIYRC